MRDIDRALAQAYEAASAQRRAANDPPAAPPTTTSQSAVSPPPPDDRPGGARDIPPPPHFHVPKPTVERLAWPATVKALEREHGDRFEALADQLLRARERANIRVLLVTSCHRAEGRTTLVLTTARALARRPGSTLVVDGDLSGPMLARLLGLRPRVGLDDVVTDGMPLDEAIVEAPDDHLSVLPLRAPVAQPREFLGSAGWSCLMARLRRTYDLVLIDGSPVFAGLSAAVLHRSVDAAVLVHHRSLTGDRAVHRAKEVLEAGGVPLLGLAETFV